MNEEDLKHKEFPPPFIEKLSRAAKLYREAGEMVKEIEDLFEETFYSGDFNTPPCYCPFWRSGNGRSLEEIEAGVDVSAEIAELYDT